MLLITGATGNVGRLLIDQLALAGAKVRAVTRNPPSTALHADVEIIAGDPTRPDTLAPALAGATGLFVNPRSVGHSIDRLLTLARDSGVQRVVTLSAINVDDDLAEQPSRYNGDRNKEVEDAVTRCGLPYVSLRPTFFAINTISIWASQIRAGDVIRGPYAAAAEAPIDLRDLAEVGARALLTDELVGQRPELTGPQSLTYEEMVAAVGKAIGRRLRYAEIPPAAAQQGMVAHGLVEPFVTAYLARLARTVGQPAVTTGEVERILGRPARTFAQWAADHAAAFTN
jgi:uncharacterized protein YbjT (DUF2867 family)